MAVIYALTDHDGATRYIGKAVDPATRYQGHLDEARTKTSPKTHKANWLRKLLREGSRPGLLIIEECEEAVWEERERYWIAEYRRRGANLTNATDGGEGRTGPISAVGRANMSKAKRGVPKSPEHREALRQAALKRMENPAAKAQIEAARKLGGFAGRKHTQSTKSQMSAVHSAQCSEPETRERMLHLAQLGRQHRWKRG